MENFIESVESQICLWKIDEKCYKNVEMKEQVWENIAKKHRMTNAKDAKYQWKKLRDSFRDAVRRQQESGDETRRIWVHQKQMEFLLPYMYKRSRKYLSFEGAEDENKLEQTFLEEIEDDEEDEKQLLEMYSEENMHDPPNKKIKLEYVQENFEPILKKPEENRENCTKSIIEENSNGSLKEFFNSMYLTTSTMPLHLQLKIKRALFEAVLEAEEMSIT